MNRPAVAESVRMMREQDVAYEAGCGQLFPLTVYMQVDRTYSSPPVEEAEATMLRANRA